MTTSKTEGGKCTVCRRNRQSLKLKKSRLNPAMQLFLCNECLDGKREPRFLIVLIARDENLGGIRAVRDYIRGHKYYGDKIRAEEIVT